MGGEENRICRHCLLSEVDPEAFRRDIAGFIERLGNNRTEETVYGNRLTICRGCDRLIAGTCLVCGCYVEIRAAAKTGHCPRKKW